MAFLDNCLTFVLVLFLTPATTPKPTPKLLCVCVLFSSAAAAAEEEEDDVVVLALELPVARVAFSTVAAAA
jgi:hypothetical protein